MSLRHPNLAVSLSGGTLLAVSASAGAKGIEIRKWHRAEMPGGIEVEGAGAVAKWVREELRGAGLLRGVSGAVMAVARGDVVLKRVPLPAGIKKDEIPEAVRLQVMRQLTVSPGGVAVDYVPVGSPPSAVLAGVLQGETLAAKSALARGVGLRLARVGLLAEGGAALLAEAAERRNGGTLAVLLGVRSVEFVVLKEGQILLARAADVEFPGATGREGGAEEGEGHGVFRQEDVAAYCQRVGVEAKRTAMTARVSPDAPEIEAIAVLGEGPVARAVAEACGQMLEIPAAAERGAAGVVVPKEIGQDDLPILLPLAGLLAQPALGRPTLNFLRARRTPDRAGARRKRVLLAVMGAIALCGGLYTTAQTQVARKRAALRELEESVAQAREAYSAFRRLQARVEHVERWQKLRVDWLSHLDELAGALPPASEGVLDRLAGDSRADVTYGSGRRAAVPQGWNGAVQAVFDLAGRVKQRSIADALRESFVRDRRYAVASPGPDLPEQFTLRLTTSHAVPPALAHEAAAAPGERGVPERRQASAEGTR